MLHNHCSAVAGGSEAIELIRLLTSQPDGPLRNQLLQSIKQAVAEPLPLHSSFESEVESLTRGIPPFIRLPKPGQRCPYSGLSRTGMAELISPCERNNHQPPVGAIHRRSHPRAKRGIWQIPTKDLFRYLLEQRKNTAQSYAEMREARHQASCL